MMFQRRGRVSTRSRLHTSMLCASFTSSHTQTGQKRGARPPGKRWRNKEVNGRTLVRAAKRAERITEEVAAEARSKAEARGGVKARTGKRKEELCSQLKARGEELHEEDQRCDAGCPFCNEQPPSFEHRHDRPHKAATEGGAS